MADMAAMKREIEYAHSQSVEVGGYDLIDLDRAGLGYEEELISMDGTVSHCLCLVCSTTFATKIVPLPCVSTGRRFGLLRLQVAGFP